MIDNLRHIRAFLAVTRIGNFTRTATELHISQSALSLQIKQLEHDLGVVLFDRGKRKTSLTRAGHDVLVPLERLLVDAEAVMSRTSQISGLRRGIVSIAVLPSIAATVVPTAVWRFTRLHPGITVQIKDVVADKIIEAVMQGEVDFGIGGRVQPNRELKCSPLLIDHLCAFVDAGHEFAGATTVSLRQITASPLILTGRDSSVRELVERALKREGLPFTLAYEANYISTALGLVESALGVAILPETSLGPDPLSKIKRLPIREPTLSRKIDLIQKKERSLSPAAEKMVKIFKELCAEMMRGAEGAKPTKSKPGKLSKL